MGKLNVKCFTCMHKDVCKFIEDYKSAIKALEIVHYTLGDKCATTIRDTPWLDIELKCKNEIHRESTGEYK